MFYVDEDGSIHITRGDTGRLGVELMDDAGEPYDVQPGDVIILSVKKDLTIEQPLIEKILTGQTTFFFQSADTERLDPGKYLYDVEVTTVAGDRITICLPTLFEVLKEVTTHGHG